MRKVALGLVVVALVGCGGGGGSSSRNPFAGTRSGTYALTLYSTGLTPDTNPNVVGAATGTVSSNGTFNVSLETGFSLTGHVAKDGTVTGAVYHYLHSGSDTTLPATATMSVTGGVVTLVFDAYTDVSNTKGVHYSASLS